MPENNIRREIIPLTFGRARIIVTEGTFVFNAW
jgi:hypothetical protein